MQGLLSIAECWLPEQDSISIHGLSIGTGGFYTGPSKLNASRQAQEPSFVDQSLAVDMICPDFSGSTLDDCLDYRFIPPSARAGYLHYLAEGRSNASSPIGFVFLYFYGLERRLLVDFQEGSISKKAFSQALGEVNRLRYLYVNASEFSEYAQRLLDFIKKVYGAPRCPEHVPVFEEGDASLANSQFAFELGTFIALGQPIPAYWAYLWLMHDGRYGHRVPMERCPEFFKCLFMQLYSQKCESTLLNCDYMAKVSLIFEALNPSIGNVSILTNVPNVIENAAAMAALFHLADECNDALNSYSRFVGQHPSRSNSLAAVALLPAKLAVDYSFPIVEELSVNIKQNADEHGYLRVDVDDIKEGIVINDDGHSSIASMEALASFLEKKGIGIAPDYRYSQSLPKPSQYLLAYALNVEKDPALEFSECYPTALLMMKAAAFIFEDVEALSLAQIDAFHHYMTTAAISEGEQQYLWAHFYWLLSAQEGLSSLRKAAKQLSGSNLQSIQKVLILAASVGGLVTSTVMLRLQQVTEQFGLNAENLYSDIHVAMSEPVLVSIGDNSDSGFDIPSEESASTVPSPSSGERPALNLDVIRQKRQESESVSDLLKDIFDTSDEPVSASAPTIIEPITIETGMDSIDGLDSAHFQFLQSVVQADGEMPLAAAEARARELNLMLNGAIDTINEAAFELADAPVLEEDGSLLILDQEIFEEMKA